MEGHFFSTDKCFEENGPGVDELEGAILMTGLGLLVGEEVLLGE